MSDFRAQHIFVIRRIRGGAAKGELTPEAASPSSSRWTNSQLVRRSPFGRPRSKKAAGLGEQEWRPGKGRGAPSPPNWQTWGEGNQWENQDGVNVKKEKSRKEP